MIRRNYFVFVIIIIYLHLFTCVKSLSQQQFSPLQENAAWPKLGRNQFQRSNSFFNHTWNSHDSITVKWYIKDDIGFHFGGIRTSVVIDFRGLIFVGAGNTLIAIESRNTPGVIRWQLELSSTVRSTPCITGNGHLIVGSRDNYLYNIYPNGTIHWKVQVRSIIDSSPTVGLDGTIYIGSEDNFVYAIYPNGTIRAEFDAGLDVESSPSIDYKGNVIIGCDDGRLYYLTPDLSLIWFFPTESDIRGGISIDRSNNFYFGNRAGFVYALRDTNELIWKVELGDAVLSTPAISDYSETLYVSCNDAHLYALHINTGVQKWNFTTLDENVATPVVTKDDIVIFGSVDNRVYAVKDGVEIWHYELDDDIIGSVAIGEDSTIYIGDISGHLVALASETNVCQNYEFAIPNNYTANSINTDYAFCVCRKGTGQIPPYEFFDQDQICNKCGVGQFSDEIIGGEICETCPSGTVNPNTFSVSIDACEICPAGLYANSEQSRCLVCPSGTFTDSPSSSECRECPFPTWSHDDEITCGSLFLNTPGWLLILIICLYVTLFTTSIMCIESRFVRNHGVYFFVNFVDSITDIIYLLTQEFYHPLLFVLFVITLFVPGLIFSHRLMVHDVRPKEFYPSFMSRIWLIGSIGSNGPTLLGQDMAIVPKIEATDNLFKFIYLSILWVLAFIPQLVLLVAYLIYDFPRVIYTIACITVGSMLTHMEVIYVRNVSLIWHKFFTGKIIEYSDDVVLNGIIVNHLTSYHHFVLIAAHPISLIVVITNSILKNEQLDAFVLASLVSTAFNIVDTAYQNLYYVIFQKLRFDEVPLYGGIPFIFRVNMNPVSATLVNTQEYKDKLLSEINTSGTHCSSFSNSIFSNGQKALDEWLHVSLGKPAKYATINIIDLKISDLEVLTHEIPLRFRLPIKRVLLMKELEVEITYTTSNPSIRNTNTSIQMTDTSVRDSDKVHKKVDINETHKDKDSERNTVNVMFSDTNMNSSDAAHSFEHL